MTNGFRELKMSSSQGVSLTVDLLKDSIVSYIVDVLEKQSEKVPPEIRPSMGEITLIRMYLVTFKQRDIVDDIVKNSFRYWEAIMNMTPETIDKHLVSAWVDEAMTSISMDSEYSRYLSQFSHRINEGVKFVLASKHLHGEFLDKSKTLIRLLVCYVYNKRMRNKAAFCPVIPESFDEVIFCKKHNVSPPKQLKTQ